MNVKVELDIMMERQFQETTFGPDHDDKLNVEAWGALLLRHNGLAMEHTTIDKTDWQRFYKQMIRSASIAVAAAEAALRKMNLPVEKTAEGLP